MPETSTTSRIARQLTLRRLELTSLSTTTLAYILTVGIVSKPSIFEANPITARVAELTGWTATGILAILVLAGAFALFRRTRRYQYGGVRVAHVGAMLVATSSVADFLINVIRVLQVDTPISGVVSPLVTSAPVVLAALIAGGHPYTKLIFEAINEYSIKRSGQRAVSVVIAVLVATSMIGGVVVIGTQPITEQQSGTASAAFSWTEEWSATDQGGVVDMETHQSEGYITVARQGSPFTNRYFDGSRGMWVTDYGANTPEGDYAVDYGYGTYVNDESAIYAYDSKTWETSHFASYYDSDIRQSDGYTYALGSGGMIIYDQNGTEVTRNSNVGSTDTPNRIEINEAEDLVLVTTQDGVEAYDLALNPLWTYNHANLSDVHHKGNSIYALTTGGDVLKLTEQGGLEYDQNVAPSAKDLAVGSSGNLYVAYDTNVAVASQADGAVIADKTGSYNNAVAITTYVKDGTTHVLVGENNGDNNDASVYSYDTGESTTTLSSLSTSNTDGNSTELSWNANAVDTTNVEYKPTDTSTWTTYSTIDGATTTETLTGLKNGEAYDIRVVADSDSTVKSTNTVTTSLPADDQPTLTTPAEGQITVDRETVTTNNGNVEIQYRETGAASWNTWSTVPYEYTTIDITNLSDETEYEFRLQTQTEHATAPWTDPVTAKTLTPTEQLGGTVVNQNGQPVANATVTVTGIDRERLSVDPGQIDARVDEIENQITNPEPPDWDPDRQLTSSDGLFGDATTSYVAAHPTGDWGLTAFSDEPQLGNPRVQLPANEEIALSVWDPAKGGLYQDGVNRDLPGGVVDDTAIVVERIDHQGDTVDRLTFQTQTTYDVALGGTHDLATVELPAGFYYIYPEDSPETKYMIVVGDTDQIVGSIRADLKNQKGELTAQAQEVREYMNDDVLKQYKTTTDANGHWSVDVPASVSRVTVQAHRAPPGLHQDPQNASLQDVREFYAVTDYNGSYVMPANAGTYDVPSSSIRVEVVETGAPQFADLNRFRNATERFQSLLQNLSYSELPATLQQRLDKLDRKDLQETSEQLQQLTNQNSQLEQRVTELLGRDFDDIEVNDSSDAALREQIQAQQQAISELRSTIEATDTSSEIGADVANSTATFGEDLSTDQVRVVANFPNGTSREVPNEYLTLDQSAGTLVGIGGTDVTVTNYPLGGADSVTFDYIVVTPDGIGETTTRAGVSNIGLDALSLSTLRPGPDERVEMTLVGGDDTQVTSITDVRAVAPDGSTLNTSTAGPATATFRTAGTGPHYVEVTFETASGTTGTLTHRVAAGETDQAMPPGIRIKDTPFGTLAVVGDGFETGSIDIQAGGAQLDVTGQISVGQDAPASMHIYAHGTDVPPDATFTVSIVRGDDQQSIQRHVEVTAHLPAMTTENAVLYRSDDALPREGEGRIGAVSTSPDETTIRTVTDTNGQLTLKTNNDPGWNERMAWWIDRNVNFPDIPSRGQIPGLPISTVWGPMEWANPIGLATTSTFDTPTASAVLL